MDENVFSSINTFLIFSDFSKLEIFRFFLQKHIAIKVENTFLRNDIIW